MGTIHPKIFGLRSGGGLALAAALLLPARPASAQLPSGFGQTTDFSSVEYYEDPPFDTQIKTRLSGAESRPVPGSAGQLEVRQLRIENYRTNGQLEAVITAPECIYSTTENTAHSAGPITVQTGDGKSVHSGVGFLWRQTEGNQSLIISNQVHTVISDEDLTAAKATAPKTGSKNDSKSDSKSDSTAAAPTAAPAIPSKP